MRNLLFSLLLLSACASSAQADDRSITVQAQGYVEAIPDTLTLMVSVKQTGSDLAKVRREVDALSAKLTKRALANGVAADDIDSSRMRVWPEYEWRKNERHYLGDSVQRDIVLKVRDLEQYSPLVRDLTKLPLHQLHQPQLSHSNIEELRLQALRVALVQGSVKARAIAQGVDAVLGPVISVEERSSRSPAPQRMMAEAASMDSNSSQPSFSFAKQRINAQVEIRYSLN